MPSSLPTVTTTATTLSPATLALPLATIQITHCFYKSLRTASDLADICERLGQASFRCLQFFSPLGLTEPFPQEDQQWAFVHSRSIPKDLSKDPNARAVSNYKCLRGACAFRPQEPAFYPHPNILVCEGPLHLYSFVTLIIRKMRAAMEADGRWGEYFEGLNDALTAEAHLLAGEMELEWTEDDDDWSSKALHSKWRKGHIDGAILEAWGGGKEKFPVHWYLLRELESVGVSYEGWAIAMEASVRGRFWDMWGSHEQWEWAEEVWDAYIAAGVLKTPQGLPYAPDLKYNDSEDSRREDKLFLRSYFTEMSQSPSAFVEEKDFDSISGYEDNGKRGEQTSPPPAQVAGTRITMPSLTLRYYMLRSFGTFTKQTVTILGARNTPRAKPHYLGTARETMMSEHPREAESLERRWLVKPRLFKK
ncbi:hypothetical protein BJ508DRAFT_306316 [Ascobolus immersus RN42]|uniref:Uncharacterized protein n=1 Tax=Ascobolus immersus RN42 TaxID=1160509 RepID=A0A3N4I6J9_ASCIM|nr:hypothetical protein BJ508DRAFT_306316 [Ascobolus immersus RN42]